MLPKDIPSVCDVNYLPCDVSGMLQAHGIQEPESGMME